MKLLILPCSLCKIVYFLSSSCMLCFVPGFLVLNKICFEIFIYIFFFIEVEIYNLREHFGTGPFQSALFPLCIQRNVVPPPNL